MINVFFYIFFTLKREEKKNMIKFLKFVNGMIILISLFFVVRDVSDGMPFLSLFSKFCFLLYKPFQPPFANTDYFLFYISAPPVYCIDDEDCYDLCTAPLVEICTNYQCICLQRF